jgi:hypothetical protein
MVFSVAFQEEENHNKDALTANQPIQAPSQDQEILEEAAADDVVSNAVPAVINLKTILVSKNQLRLKAQFLRSLRERCSR